MATRTKNLGMIGLGYWGKNILRNLYGLGVLAKACDASRKMIEQRKKDHPNIEYTCDMRDLFEDPKIKGIVIAAPAALHYKMAKMAIESGKDVFVEKPLALTLKEGEELVRLAKKKKRILMVGHILQYHSAVIKLKKMIDKGMLGDVRYIYSNRLNIGKLRVEENILWSFAPHDISTILMLVGKAPKKVSCFGESYLSHDVMDVTMTTLDFGGKIKGHILVSWLHPFKEQKLVVVGSKAMAVFDDMTAEKLFIYPHKIKWNRERVPIALKAEHYPVKLDLKEPLKEELKHFIGCMKTRKAPRTDGNEGLRVLRVLEDAEKQMKRISRKRR